MARLTQWDKLEAGSEGGKSEQLRGDIQAALKIGGPDTGQRRGRPTTGTDLGAGAQAGEQRPSTLGRALAQSGLCSFLIFLRFFFYVDHF